VSQYWTQRQIDSARRFFFVALLVFITGGLLAALLIAVARPLHTAERVGFPKVFLVSTGMLFAGSISLQRALHFVRLERQGQFRTAMLCALVAGSLFVGVQSFGLWQMLQAPLGTEASTGSGAFAFVLTVLHAMHLSVALLFLTYVTVRAFAGRYDHEYYWGVTCCVFFWHALLIIWLAILAVFAIAV
jgi:cytochrome c oxidase subunit 3